MGREWCSSLTKGRSLQAALPYAAGNVRLDPLWIIYEQSHLFKALRDPGQLHGRCEHSEICGGSHSKTYAASGDPLGEDSSCTYEPTCSTSWRPAALNGSG